MTLYELGEEYIKQAEIIANQKKKLEKKLHLYSGLDLIEQRGKVMKLSTISGECKRTGEYLMNYYTDGANVLRYNPPYEEIKIIRKF